MARIPGVHSVGRSFFRHGGRKRQIDNANAQNKYTGDVLVSVWQNRVRVLGGVGRDASSRNCFASSAPAALGVLALRFAQHVITHSARVCLAV